ncbi:hypothetical protein [Halobaculum roseum]|uniref:DUF3298 domain-containing protein n=1 Tax=Halobaculum roseum TaxID=2175149 RepID=A0ABD5MNQ9_9EURY|nr:hypothetical protein [Halobaculum roseum]QZY01800.1 hypothetical protein K6T36_10760 [Halobaculum roseum]
MDARSRARLALALLLVTAPLWGPPLDLTGPDYAYRTADITVEDGEVSMPELEYRRGPTDRIACFSTLDTVYRDRGCYLESRLRDGNVSVDYPGTGTYGGDPHVFGPEYVVFGTSGPVYERTVSHDTTNGSFVLGVDRVDPEVALDDVASDPEGAPPVVREALAAGEARRDEPIRGHDPGRIYREDGGFVVVYEEEVHTGYSEQPGIERGFEAIAVLFGALTVYQVGRDSVRQS